MVVTFFILMTGFGMLVWGANYFVDGSASLAKNFKVSGLIIGLTIVACGTSAPELAVSVTAAMENSSEIALSNILGSNLFNLLGILGICAIMSPLVVEKVVLKRDFTVVLASTLFLFMAIGGFALTRRFSPTGPAVIKDVATVTSAIGATLVIAYIIYVAWIFIKGKEKNNDETSCIRSLSNAKCLIFIVAGLITIVVGGKLVVQSAEKLALLAGMSETLVGLTIVAIGTSLPELVTSVVATRKGQLGIALGNVLGSNIFNLLFILGVSALISPVAINVASVFDLLILLVTTAVGWIFAFTELKFTRREGMLMVCMYLAAVVYAAVRI